MLTRQDIIKAVKEFVASAHDNDVTIERILLFGSYAKGNPHKYRNMRKMILSRK